MEKKVTITGQINSSINFAMQQNYVPVIRNLVVGNDTKDTLKNLRLKITFDSNFAREFICDIETIEAGEAVEITPVKIILSVHQKS